MIASRSRNYRVRPIKEYYIKSEYPALQSVIDEQCKICQDMCIKLSKEFKENIAKLDKEFEINLAFKELKKRFLEEYAKRGHI